MHRQLGRGLGNIKLTTMIAVLVISAVLVSIAATTAATFVTMRQSLQATAETQRQVNLKTAATILQGKLPGAELSWSEDVTTLARIEVFAMPGRFSDHGIVDAIAAVTDQQASIYTWDEAAGDFVNLTTTFEDAGGLRQVSNRIGPDNAVFASVIAGDAYLGEETVLGRHYYTAYQPIVNRSGKALGMLFVGLDKAGVENMIAATLRPLLIVSAITLAVMAIVGWALSRAMMRPIPALAKIMKRISGGEYDLHVPYSQRRNEIGDMARAVEIFRENGLAMTQMTEEERAASQRRRIERTDMMVALQAAFGEVVDAAIAGDFSKRVHAQFPDQELNSLAGSVNTLVETVDRGLGETGQVLGALANADLTHRVEGDYLGAFARLRDDTNAVAEKLSTVMGRLRTTSRALKTATSEILSGANDLSERTTKQAATIEETSAAMEQLASTVADNARMADDANTKAGAVSNDAARSGEVMDQANQAMERITQSSSKISNIIGLIDDIAFQTNLLALNASVEAARAGEAGKGFAVVAVEVRRLAQSAAEASSEVKALIDASAVEVTSGSRLVSSAAGQLRQMLEAVHDNAVLMQSIAQASKAQAAAIDEVGVAVRTLDEMTQHNAALVEQTNAAIEQTESQASELDRVVDIFTIEPGGSQVEAPAQARAKPHSSLSQPRSKLAGTARTYLSEGNAALSSDWSEF